MCAAAEIRRAMPLKPGRRPRAFPGGLPGLGHRLPLRGEKQAAAGSSSSPCWRAWPAWALAAPWASAAEVLMKDGRVLHGKLGKVGGLTDLNFFATADDAEQLKLIVFLDDDLRRTFVPQRQIQDVHPDRSTQIEEKFHIKQRDGRRRTGGADGRADHEDADRSTSIGRRIVTMNTPRGPVDIIQGITEITPQWTKVEGITYMWDMRIATSSIPRDVLHKLLLRQAGDPENIDQRKRSCAVLPASGAVPGGPARSWRPSSRLIRTAPTLKEQLAPTIRALRQLDAQRLLRRTEAARQPPASTTSVLAVLKKFPSDDVAGETLQAVRELIQEYETAEAQRAKASAEIAALLGKTQGSGDAAGGQVVAGGN